jgi:polyhydroxybutyrate depolymerase
MKRAKNLPIATFGFVALLALIALVIVSAVGGEAQAASTSTGSPETRSQNLAHKSLALGSGRTLDIQYFRTGSAPRPLVVMLPGLGETPATLEGGAQAYAFGRTHGITIVYAHALPAPDGTLAWNAGECCEGQGTDDVSYLKSVVAAAANLTAVDRHRVYLVGMSNGGMMALTALCQAPNTFAAAVSVAGPFLGLTCSHTDWLHLAGTADQIVPIVGGYESWCACDLPATTTEALRFPGATVQIVSGANHTWPLASDNTWRFNGMTRAWAFLSTRRG